MPKKPVDIGTLHVEKKGDALDFLKTMLNSYSVGETVSDEHLQILLAALDNHPESETKVGCGVFYISVGRGDYDTQCFWINRTDGTTERFSYKSCV